MPEGTDARPRVRVHIEVDSGVLTQFRLAVIETYGTAQGKMGREWDEALKHRVDELRRGKRPRTPIYGGDR